MKGVESFKHQANKKRDSESDIPDKFRVMKYLKKHFGIITLTDEVVLTPGGYANYRKPDLFSKPYKIAFELDGEGVHGLGEPINQREKDWRKLDDYQRIGLEFYVLNSAQTDGYEEESVVKSLKEQGLSVH